MKFHCIAISFAVLGVISTTLAAPWVVLDTRSDMLAMSSEVSEVVATTAAATALPDVEAVTVAPENISDDDVVAATEPQPEPEVAAVGVDASDAEVVDTTQSDDAVIETTTSRQEPEVPLSDVDKEEGIISKEGPFIPREKQNAIKEEVKKQVRQSVETAHKKIHDIIKKHKYAM
ncbi:hypothetical protein Ocin01_01224 [Orchesella cincta]|uniref:Uncharacterized protein n=1 Tax=Orchesella cincta TaxID=48709 RepID=A0A1D2NJT4_ORCCI|nr:hypothetical protein Ocin01_01224 [Orchesella cincta]